CLPNRIFRIQLTVQILLVTLLPAIILLFTNIKIALTLAKRRYRWMEMGEQTSTLSTSTSNTVGTLDPEHLMCESHQQAYKQEQQFVLRLLLVSMLFWILNLPLFMYGTLREIQEQAGTKALATTVFMNGYFVSQFLSHLNNCVNFYVYCFIGSTFREATLALLVCDWRRYTYWSAELQKGYLDTSDTPLKGFPHCTHKKDVYELCIPNNVYRVLRLMQIPLIVVLPGIILTFENSKIAFTLAKRRSQWMGSTFSDEGCSNWDKNRNRQSGNEKRSNSAHVNNPMAECHRQAKDQEDRLTLQLLIVSCAFWILSMPSLIFVGLRALAENANTAHHVSETFANGYYVSWFLYQLNMCIDFFIYCVVGSTFRETLWALLERDWSRFHRLRNALCKGRLIDSSDGVTTSDSRRLN
ncbi:hypothetical protein X801_06429, partial [Opisthorchis viverrini]